MNRSAFDTEFQQLLEEANSLIPTAALPDFPENEAAMGWYNHELALWNIGEKIRQLSLCHRRQLTRMQMEAVVSLCLNKQARKGRQSFVMLLGKTKYSSFAASIAPLLQDPDVEGHVISTLYKMKASGYADQIRPFLTHEQTWIRREAQRYLLKFSKPLF